MAAMHHGYNVLKMPGSGGVITVACQEKDAVCSLECAFQATAVENPEAEGGALLPEVTPRRRSCSWDRGLVKDHRPRKPR